MSHDPSHDELPAKFYDARLARRVLPYLAPYRWPLAGCALLVLAVMGLELAGPWVVREMIDRAIGGRSRDLADHYALLYLGLLVAVFTLQYAEQYWLQWIGQRVVFKLRQTLFEHLQGLSLGFFSKKPVGALLTRVMFDVENINALFTDGLINILGDLVILAGVIGVMLAMSAPLALLMLATLPMVIAAAILFRRFTIQSYRKLRTYSAALNAQLQEAITGMSTIQAFGQERRVFKQFDAQNLLFRDEANRVVFYTAVFNPTITAITGLAQALIIGCGGSRVLQGALTVGIMAAFFQYVERLFTPIRDLSEKYTLIQQAMTSAERIFQLLDVTERIPETSTPSSFPQGAASVEFRRVSLSYDGRGKALEEVSFRVEGGGQVAFVGHTGAGKTSLMNALTRLYPFQEGEILVGGINVKNFRKADLRRSVGLVLQDPFMFSGTLLDNIRLGASDLDERRVREICEQLGIDAWIRSLPQGYNEVLRERGVNLSTGQKQLLACARILARDPRVLVLDEATSSMDPHTEWLVRRALVQIMGGRTTLMIAHRLATVQDLEQIVVLHHGRVVESGTHHALLRHGGHYAALYRIQAPIASETKTMIEPKN